MLAHSLSTYLNLGLNPSIYLCGGIVRTRTVSRPIRTSCTPSGFYKREGNVVKGQTILKANYGVLNSPKKRTLG